MEIFMSRIDKSLPLPKYHSDGAAAFDLYSRVDMMIGPKEIGLIPTNFIIATPPGHALIVVSRSSTPKRKGLIIPHGIGVVDPDYRGPKDEVLMQVLNNTDQPVDIARGERIGQAFIVATPRLTFVEADPTDGPSRGGIGSTGT